MPLHTEAIPPLGVLLEGLLDGAHVVLECFVAHLVKGSNARHVAELIKWALEEEEI